MVCTASGMVSLGTSAPPFALENTDGQTVCLEDFSKQQALVVMFICNHCPYVQHLEQGLARFGADYAKQSVGIVAINSNDISTHPEDSPSHMQALVARVGYTFPYLFDASQEVAKAYGAACTPDFFLFDAERKLVYRGQFDHARPSTDEPITGVCLRAAVDAVLSGNPVTQKQHPSLGCNIKWKTSNDS